MNIYKKEITKVITNHFAYFIYFFVFITYVISTGGIVSDQIQYIVLAQSFLHGHLYIRFEKQLTELIHWQGRYYVIYPPLPGIILMPFVFLYNNLFLQSLLSLVIAPFTVVLAYTVFTICFKEKISYWLTFLYAFGSMAWYHALNGSSWYFAHTLALFFLWLFLYEAFTKKRFTLMGILIGCAFLCRLPTIFTFIFVLIYFHKEFVDKGTIHIKQFASFFCGIISAIVLYSFYSFARFRSFSDYIFIYHQFKNEPWFQYGYENVRYIPIHMREIITSLPSFTTKPPYVLPSLWEMALWFVTPALLVVFFAPLRNKLTLACWVTVIVVALPGLMHGSPGAFQFGFRYALDYMPFLFMLIGLGLKGKITHWAKVVIFLSIAVNVWGIILINFFYMYTT